MWSAGGKDIFSEGFSLHDDYAEAVDFNHMGRMKIASGSSGAFSHDPTLDGRGVRVHASLVRGASPAELAAAFQAAGWSARKSAWDEYELRQTWAELNLLAYDQTPVLSGLVLPECVDDLLELLGRLAGAYRGELYDPAGALLRSFASDE